MNGSCCLRHALELLSLAGHERTILVFLGTDGIADLRFVLLQLRGRELIPGDIPAALVPACKRLTLAVRLALDIHRPGWQKGTGAIGQAKITIDREIRIAGMELGGKREAFCYRCRPEDLIPRGEGPVCQAALPWLELPKAEPVRAG